MPDRIRLSEAEKTAAHENTERALDRMAAATPKSSRVVELTDAERRQRARDKVASRAAAGKVPSQTWAPHDLEWAFEGREQELEDLERLAVEAGEARRAERREVSQAQELRRVTMQIEQGMIAAEKRERRARAEAEARRRLGLDEDGPA